MRLDGPRHHDSARGGEVGGDPLEEVQEGSPGVSILRGPPEMGQPSFVESQEDRRPEAHRVRWASMHQEVLGGLVERNQLLGRELHAPAEIKRLDGLTEYRFKTVGGRQCDPSCTPI